MTPELAITLMAVAFAIFAAFTLRKLKDLEETSIAHSNAMLEAAHAMQRLSEGGISMGLATNDVRQQIEAITARLDALCGPEKPAQRANGSGRYQTPKSS